MQMEAVDHEPEREGCKQELCLPPGLADEREVHQHRDKSGQGGEQRAAAGRAEHTDEPPALEEQEVGQGGAAFGAEHQVPVTGSPIRASTRWWLRTSRLRKPASQ